MRAWGFAFVVLLPHSAALDVSGFNSQPRAAGSLSLVDIPVNTTSISFLALDGASISSNTQMALSGSTISWSTFTAPAGWYVLQAVPSGHIGERSVYLHDGYTLSSTSTPTAGKYSVAGKQTLTVLGTGFYSTLSATFRFTDSLQMIEVSGTVDPSAGIASTTTPAWNVSRMAMTMSPAQSDGTRPRRSQAPAAWYAGCADASNPVLSATCVPDLIATISVSLDGGITFSPEVQITYGWVRPLKVAWLYVGHVDDFGWNYAVNLGRLAVCFGRCLPPNSRGPSAPNTLRS